MLQNCKAGADLSRTDAWEALTGPLSYRTVVLYSEGDHAGKEHTKQETLTTLYLVSLIPEGIKGLVESTSEAMLFSEWRSVCGFREP